MTKDAECLMFSVSHINSNLIGPEGVVFQIDENGPILIVRMQRPSKKEIDSFDTGKPLEMRFIELGSVIFMTFKFSDLPWIDAPYTVHLSPHLTDFKEVCAGEGYGVRIICCGTDGMVYNLRIVSMSTRFSREFYRAVIRQSKTKFDFGKYKQEINQIYSRYLPKDLARLARNYMKWS